MSYFVWLEMVFACVVLVTEQEICQGLENLNAKGSRAHMSVIRHLDNLKDNLNDKLAPKFTGLVVIYCSSILYAQVTLTNSIRVLIGDSGPV